MKGDRIYELMGGIREEFLLEAEPKRLAALAPAKTEPAVILHTLGENPPPRRKKRWLPLVIAAAIAVTVGLNVGLFSGLVALTDPNSGFVPVTPSSPSGNPFGDLFGSLFPFLQPDETEPPYEATVRDPEDITEPTDDTDFEDTVFEDTTPEPMDPCAQGHRWIVTNKPTATACYTDEKVNLACMQCGHTESTTESGHVYLGGYCQICHMIEGAFEGVYVITETVDGRTEGCIAGHDKLPDGDVLILPNYYYHKDLGMIPITSIQLVDLHKTTATKLIIPEGIRTICDNALDASQTIVEISLPDTLEVIGNEAFQSSEALTTIRMSSNLVSLGDRCFENCTLLTAVELPSTLTSLGKQCFYGCRSLQSVTMAGQPTEIPKQAFAGCRALERITLPEGLLRIGESAFSSCEKLNAVSLPDTLVAIGAKAFINSGIQVLILPAAMEEIGDQAFAESGLTEVRFKNTAEQGELTLGTAVFKECEQLKIVSLYNAPITCIPASTFEGCKSMYSITLPRVTSIGSSAFGSCMSLPELTLPSTLTDIADYTVFKSCYALELIAVEDGCQRYTVQGGCLIDRDTSTLLLGTSAAVIPDDGSIKSIAPLAFAFCRMKSIVIPDSVEVFGEIIFYSCEQLETVTIPASVKEITDSPYIFAYCNSLTDIHYGGTVEEWKALTQGHPIIAIQDNPVTVHCTDGTYTEKA